MRAALAPVILAIGYWLCLGVPAWGAHDEAQNTRTFIDGVRFYEAKAYPKAIDAFEHLVADGVQNGKLYYDLGNSYLKNRSIGRAILWYERAAELIPGDPDLKYNLTYARSLVKDEGGQTASPVWHVFFFWTDFFPLKDLQWAGIVLNALFWLLLALNRALRKASLRRACYGVLFCSLLVLGTAGWRMVQKHCYPQAVILQAVVPVHSGFSQESTTLFVLHEGTQVAVERQRKGFLLIRFSKDKIGWIPQGAAGLI
jgi:tetratricopeptide (TPR) repeat protein